MRKYKSAYEKCTIHKFKDICLGEEREFDMMVWASIKIGDHIIAMVKDPDAFFYYTAVDGWLINCHYGYEGTVMAYRYLVEKYKKEAGVKKKTRNDARRAATSRYSY